MFAFTIYVVVPKNPKTLSVISVDKIPEEASYNELLDIGIPEVLMNLVSCHKFTKNNNSIFILVCRSCLVNYYFAKRFVILEHNSKKLISVPNDLKLTIHATNIQKRDMLWQDTPKFPL